MSSIFRIEVATIVSDTRAAIRKDRLIQAGFGKIKHLFLRDVYTLDKSFTPKQLKRIASSLANPVTQKAFILTHPKHLPGVHSATWKVEKFDWAIEIGFLPGVTDNVATTAKEIITDLLGVKFSNSENVYTSQITFIAGKLSATEIEKTKDYLYNPLIQRAHIKGRISFIEGKGMDFIIPKVKLNQKPQVTEVNLNVSDEELSKIGKLGIEDKDRSRRGPLSLSLLYMKTIQSYFKRLGRNPTDIELESLAQTWSEHCKHTIFADPIDEIKEGLFKTYIKKATEEIQKKKGKQDFCVSVFTDNSGAIAFDDKYLITHKVETHNTPSALDPFGGSITGIVGVNRDTIGFGLGAKPVANFYGFCFADPRIDVPLYKGPKFTQKMLSSRRIMDGVIEGVNAGGNQSGIPTLQGFLYFNERYRGKPLVFVGTVGLIPRKIKGKKAHIKRAKPGDYIVMAGGRVGKDGIHGATFSSEALDSRSPVSAVQIGDPITQKKLSDATVKEARDMLLYNSITDNGAGGLSCSVAEMAKESNGCRVNLDKVPLKYVGLAPWEIWISESQERMTLAVPKKKWQKFHQLMEERGVEATVIGEFTNSGKCQVFSRNKKIMDLDLQFLHYGLPKKQLKTKAVDSAPDVRNFSLGANPTQTLYKILSDPNIASFEFISSQYDYYVQGELVLSPLSGRGRINSEVSAFKPVLSSKKGVVCSYGLYPALTETDPYKMATFAIDTAIRNIVAAGADPNYIALLDNFCWCSSDDPQKLWQLKQAAKACFELATYYETPFISGKDSMFNDFIGFDEKGNPVKISIPPTLLVSSIGVVSDVSKLVSTDVKMPGDLVYILGNGGTRNRKLYQRFYKCIQKRLIASSISVTRGGLAVAAAKMSMAGMLGLSIKLPHVDNNLFSEKQGTIIVTTSSKNRNKFEELMRGNQYVQVGKVTDNQIFEIKNIIKTTVGRMLKYYRKTFAGY